MTQTPDAPDAVRTMGPVAILCKEIGYHFDERLESEIIFLGFVAVLVSHVSHMRQMATRLTKVTGKIPSLDSAEVLLRVERLLSARTPQIVEQAAEIHNFIDEVAPDDMYPCDPLIDMLSSCVSAVRFGLTPPCNSRHAAEAASHVWQRLYGVSCMDSLTPNWEKDWARAQMQEAILRLAIRGTSP